MKKRRGLAIFLAIAMIFCYMPATGVADVVADSNDVIHEVGIGPLLDMPEEGFWSTLALKAAVNNGLLEGFVEADGTYIRPDDFLTRAQMAAVINRAFKSKNTATLSGVSDIAPDTWYYKDMQKAVGMGTMKLDNVMRPDDNITREEAITILGRALMVEEGLKSDLGKYTDAYQIEDWASLYMGAMVKAGYIQGSNNLLTPKANMTRAELAVILYNVIKEYISNPGTFTEVGLGNLMVNEDGVTLKNLTIYGDLIVGDGIGDGTITLDNVIVEGKTIIRSGEVIIISSNSLPSGSGSGGGGSGGGDVVVNAITISQGTMRLIVGGELGTLVASILPGNATNKNITWESSNTNSATVVGGVVTPVTKGATTITVTTVDGNFLATCYVTVITAAQAQAEADALNVRNEAELRAAIANEDVAKIKLGATFTLDGTVHIDRAVTIDLNGQSVSSTFGYDKTKPDTANALMIGPNGDVEFDDNSITKKGEFKNPLKQTISNKGKLKIKGGSYGVSGEYAIVIGGESSETNIEGGTFKGSIGSNGTDNVEGGPILIISGGNFENDIYLAAGNSETTISGGTFGPFGAGVTSAIEIKAGKLTITGGTFTNNIETTSNSTTTIINGGGSGNLKGVIVAVKPISSSAIAYGSPIILEITGGTFNNNKAGGDYIVLADRMTTASSVGGINLELSNALFSLNNNIYKTYDLGFSPSIIIIK